MRTKKTCFPGKEHTCYLLNKGEVCPWLARLTDLGSVGSSAFRELPEVIGKRHCSMPFLDIKCLTFYMQSTSVPPTHPDGEVGDRDPPVREG